MCSEGAIVLPSERVLSGPEGRLLYGPEFFPGISSDEVFGDDVFFLGIGGEILTRVFQISTISAGIVA